MKNKNQLIEKIELLGITKFKVAELFISIEEMSHQNIVQLSRYIDKSENCFMILSKGVIKIKFNKY